MVLWKLKAARWVFFLITDRYKSCLEKIPSGNLDDRILPKIQEDSEIEFLRGSQCWDGVSDEPVLLYRRSNSCVVPICKDHGIYVLVKGGGNATVFGTPYNDIIKTGSGSDTIYGLGGYVRDMNEICAF